MRGLLAALFLAVTVLACAAGEARAACGDGVRDGSEQCDDGNAFDDDCCTSECRFVPSNAKCHHAVDIAPTSQQAGPFATYVAGWQFTADTPLSVVGLGLYDEKGDGFIDVHEVGLWRASGELVASATLPVLSTAPLAGRFRYVPIAAAPLQAGQSYVVAALYHQQVIEWWAIDGQQTFDPRITFQNGRDQFQVSGLKLPSQVAAQPRYGPSLLLVGDCGDGVVDGGEECDDGNAVNLDGCSDACRFDLPTPTPTGTVTPTPTETEPPTPTELPTETPLPPCVGDCGRGGLVSVGELRLMVEIALLRSHIDECTVSDVDTSSDLTIEELVQSVINFLSDCA